MTRNWKHTSTLALHPTFSLSKSAHSDEAETSLKLETIPRTTCGRLHSCSRRVCDRYGRRKIPHAKAWHADLVVGQTLTMALPFL